MPAKKTAAPKPAPKPRAKPRATVASSAKPAFKYPQYDTNLREPGSKYSTEVRVGQRWHADYPLVKAHPEVFGDEPTGEPYPRGWQPPVEQATAAPGEVRDTGRG